MGNVAFPARERTSATDVWHKSKNLIQWPLFTDSRDTSQWQARKAAHSRLQASTFKLTGSTLSRGLSHPTSHNSHNLVLRVITFLGDQIINSEGVLMAPLRCWCPSYLECGQRWWQLSVVSDLPVSATRGHRTSVPCARPARHNRRVAKATLVESKSNLHTRLGRRLLLVSRFVDLVKLTFMRGNQKTNTTASSRQSSLMFSTGVTATTSLLRTCACLCGPPPNNGSETNYVI